MSNQNVNDQDKDLIIKRLEEELADARRQLDDLYYDDYGQEPIPFEQLREELLSREEELFRTNEINKLQLEKLQMVVQATKIGLWEYEIVLDDIANPANAFDYSDELRRLLGFTDKNDFPNVLGSWIDSLHPEDRDGAIEHAINHILDDTGNTPYDTEFRLLRKNGEYGYFRSYGGTFRNEKGEPTLLAGSLIDITESKQIEKVLQDALDESNRTLEVMKSVLNKSGAMILATDPETDTVLFMTDYMRQHFNVEGDVVGQHCYDVLHRGVKERCDFCPCTKLDKDPNTPVVWEEYSSLTNGYYKNLNSYVTWPGGKKANLQYCIDLTDVKKAQDTLEHRETLLNAMNEAAFAILAQSDDSFIADSEKTMLASLLKGMEIIGLCIEVDCIELWQNEVIDGELHTVLKHYWHTEHGKAVKAGTATSFPYSATHNWEQRFLRGECIAGPLDELLPEDREFLSDYDVQSVLTMPIFIDNRFWGICCMDDCSKKRGFPEDDINILRSSGLLFTTAMLRNEMIQNLRSTSVKLEEALIQAAAANKAKSEFLSTMSHEIRTPMNVILGITEIQLQNKALGDALREPLEKIHVAGYMLLGIINDILDLSKIESGKLELIVDAYDIASLVLDTAQLNMLQIGSKLIEFELFIDENLPTLLRGDELRVKQILNNLLTNAIKYTEIGKIELSITGETGAGKGEGEGGSDEEIVLVLRVSDTGVGMTKEQIDVLFEKFTRFTNNGSRTIEGTGLGMNITMNLVHMMKGEIFVESQPGEGSIFTVRLPQGKVACKPLGREMADNLRKIQPTGRSQIKRVQISLDPMPYGKVLVVDDVETNVYVANGLLMPYDLNIDTASSGFQAIEKVKKGSKYDVIFMDHMMPKMDGIEATKIIREMGYKGSIVALTANAVKGQADLFLKNGFDDFIPKPIDIRQLNSILNKLIRDKQPQEVVEAARKNAAKAKSQATGADTRASVDARIIEAFVRDAKKSIAILENIITKQDPLTDDDRHMYDVYTHGMKSALLHIGNSELSAVAYSLETDGRNGDIKLLAERTAEFIAFLRAQVDTLTHKDEGTVNGVERDDKPYLNEKLLIIKEACEQYDVNAAYDALELLAQESWSQPTRDLLSTIENLLISSDFDEIVSVVEKLGIRN